MAEVVKLFRTWTSPFALRVVWALKLKGIEHETIFEDLSNKSPLLLQYNPVHKKVPVLVHNGKPISESLVILEYIDETWKQNPLLPEDPYDRATARFWATFGDDKVFPLVWRAFLTQGKEQEDAVAAAIANLKFVEEELKGKKFFGGEAIGLVDLAFGWMVNMISLLEQLTSLKLIDAEKYPMLVLWMENFSEVPVINESWPPPDKLIAAFLAIRGR
ncbi:Glutathione S-transferase [Actinidia chinensis var. chinensis]|uniref:Probable glutathione S-transferase n=1 Tax=Actinidia chinensis var. chinensis TaxID=1590841 RepID=A0A2R6QPV6_ACTCC|nr:Glutathione S-transferase [Actinidia chinensis var. chinensis]